MRLEIHNSYEELCLFTSNYIIKKINSSSPKKEKPFVLCLPTGSSPLGVYKNIISAHKEGLISFKNVITFNLDEYLGIRGDHPQSYKRFMYDNLFSHIDIPMENTFIPNGMASNGEAECLAYENAIEKAGGIDLLLGGIGLNGHIAFNEPGTPSDSRTRVQLLDMETRRSNARFFDGDMEKVPAAAITMGIATIIEAREIIIIVSGSAKAKALKDAVEGGIDAMCPLSLLQNHPNVMIVCDRDAASELKQGGKF